MNKAIKQISVASTLLLAGMHAFNFITDRCLIPVTSSKNYKIYTWKNLNINYSEKGDENKPALLLIHNLSPASSQEEWYRIDNELAEHFHIYKIDLPGCGKSDKPNIIYINYLYVQLISDFIKEVIKKKTSICATEYSSSATLMAARIYPEMIDKIIIISPPPIDELIKQAAKKEKILDKVLTAPILGTFLYNCIMNKENILDQYTYEYFYNKINIPEKSVDISYYNAHYNHSYGKYLYASILSNYTNINIIHALPKIQNKIYIISHENTKEICQEYKKYNPAIKDIYVSNCRKLPQLEIPETIRQHIYKIAACS